MDWQVFDVDINKNIRWQEITVNSKCPFCGSIMLMLPLDRNPGFAFCPECKRYWKAIYNVEKSE